MNTAEIINIQNEIISRQSKLIKDMAMTLEQEEIFKKEEQEIQNLKRKLGDTNGL